MQLCTHPLSTISGVYVLAVYGKVVAVYTSLDHLKEHLFDLNYDQGSQAQISLCSLEDADADDITHLIAWDLFEGYEHYEGWARDHIASWPMRGRVGFVEYWFDQWGGEHRLNMSRRKDLLDGRPAVASAVESTVA